MKPLVSVIMPSYNAEKYIGEAIESILCQTYDNWELIIIEDCSTDNTLDTIKRYKEQRIKLFTNKYNMGIADTTNKGIRESKGKYIALLDDDDLAERDRLRLQVDYLENHPEIDVLGGRSIYIDAQGRIMDYSCIPRNNPKYIQAILLFNCMDFLNSTAMIRKEFMENNRLYYHNGYYGMQDFRFYIECSKIGNISALKDFLLKHRIYDESTTEQMMTDYKEERAKAYAQLQNYSLHRSGFHIKEEAMSFLNRVLAESGGTCNSLQELQYLYEIFKELLEQGEKMNIDYYDELNHVCRVKMADQIIKLKEFFYR